MPRYRLTVAYDGTDFKGWQKQHPPGEEPLRTVQGVLEEAVRETVREPATIIGASRTDSGVHAIGQTAAFTSESSLEPDRMVRALNSRLPDDVVVRDARFVDERFSPISQAVEKQYRYAIAFGEKAGAPRPLFDRRAVTFAPEVLDVAAMAEAASHIEGTHDFKAFTKRHHGRESTVRTVTSCTARPIGEWRVRIDVRGDGFLWNMVRIIAGTLMDVGRGRIEPGAMPEVIASGERDRGGPTMPPEGLCLLWIRYPDDPEAAELAARADTADTLDAAVALESPSASGVTAATEAAPGAEDSA